MSADSGRLSNEPQAIERPLPSEGKSVWGSDVAADMLRQQNLQEQKYSTSISTSAAKSVIAFMTKAQIVASTPSLSAAELIAPGSLAK